MTKSRPAEDFRGPRSTTRNRSRAAAFPGRHSARKTVRPDETAVWKTKKKRPWTSRDATCRTSKAGRSLPPTTPASVNSIFRANLPHIETGFKNSIRGIDEYCLGYILCVPIFLMRPTGSFFGVSPSEHWAYRIGSFRCLRVMQFAPSVFHDQFSWMRWPKTDSLELTIDS